MNKKNVLKILEGLKEIKEWCGKIDDCTECEFYQGGTRDGNCLIGFNLDGGYELPCHWEIDEIVDEMKEKIKRDEALEKSDFEMLKSQEVNVPDPYRYSHPPITSDCQHPGQKVIPAHRHETSTQDMIHHPGHYNFRGMECKDFIEKFVSDPKSYYEGNIFKYLYRYQEKNKEEDLNKAMEYTRLLKEYLYGKKD